MPNCPIVLLLSVPFLPTILKKFSLEYLSTSRHRSWHSAYRFFFDFVRFSRFLANLDENSAKSSTKRFNEHLSLLIRNRFGSDSTNLDKHLFNFSSVVFSDSEKLVLSKGLNFSVPPKCISDTENKLQKHLHFLLKKNYLFKEIYQKIRPTGSLRPRLYVLPKIHKVKLPCRTILSMVGSAQHDLAQWLTELHSPVGAFYSTVFLIRLLSPKSLEIILPMKTMLSFARLISLVYSLTCLSMRLFLFAAMRSIVVNLFLLLLDSFLSALNPLSLVSIT